MDKKNQVSFVLIALIIGFMIAIQFQTVKKPVIRDTRDTWQLREDLLKEKEQQSRLISAIRSNEEKLAKYETERKQGKEQALRDTLNELKEEAGLTEITGPGIILTIEPVYSMVKPGEPVSQLPPELLKRLINELNMYGAESVSIDGQRIINTTVIRDINRDTKIDGHSINQMPIQVKVMADSMKSAEKLYNRMQVSKSAEQFFIENIQLTVSKPENSVTIPAYQDTIRIRNLEPVKLDKGDR